MVEEDSEGAVDFFGDFEGEVGESVDQLAVVEEFGERGGDDVLGAAVED